MNDLINELTNPRIIQPTQAMFRAAKALQEMFARSQADTKARLDAEAKLVEAFGDIQRLTKELQELKNERQVEERTLGTD